MGELVSHTHAWQALKARAEETTNVHLRDLLKDEQRNALLSAEHNGIFLDYARQRVDKDTMQLLFALAKQQKVSEKIAAMFSGDKINTTENRAVLHVALRAERSKVIKVDGENVIPAVHSVLDKIRTFSNLVRNGEWVGETGKALTDVVSIGIGGSYLGAEFVHEALRMDEMCMKQASGRRLRFLANVDPVGISRAVEGLDPATTLVIIISKTFTTAETMLNARTLRNWISSALGESAVPKHMIAVSANLTQVTQFGIDSNNVFGLWDWVGGRYSVTSAVGVLPLSLQYGFDVIHKFLAGARDIDDHFQTSAPEKNLPILLGLLGVWNSSFLKHSSRVLLPYSEALLRFSAHLQQVDMESNGKRVNRDGEILDFETGEIDFGEPGTNGQHSFYQLIHQGRVVPADFIGFVHSQTPTYLKGEIVSNHDELMSNFFAQPDALAYGKTEDELISESVPENLIAHKVFSGNRPSSSLLLPKLTPFTTGQLLALYEHRTAVQGFIWDVNSFDQWGVELGKSLGKRVRNQLQKSRTSKAPIDSSFNSSSKKLLERYMLE